MATKKFKIDYSTSPDGGTCAPGYHFVRGHERVCKSGKVTWVDEHTARNPGRNASSYLSENLYFLFQESKNTYPKIGKICGFDEYEEVDPLIHFWLGYWKDRGLPFPEDLDPKLVKAVIAYESSFNPAAKSKGSSATGLMQVTNSTRAILSGSPKKDGVVEIKKEQIKVKQDDLKDPLINVAVATRWLSYKYQSLSRGSEKNAFNMLKYYNEWNERGEKYAKKVFELYQAKCH